MNSVSNCLRNTFLNKIPTVEDIGHACAVLAEKLSGNASSKNDAKLALMDVIEEALHGTRQCDSLLPYIAIGGHFLYRCHGVRSRC